MTSDRPDSVRDVSSWADLQELDRHGENLTQWEIDFVEGLTRQLLEGRYLTKRQQMRLAEIREARL